MQLTLFYANTSLEGHRRLFSRLKQTDTPVAKHVFLVPDRYTLSVERDIINNVFPDGYTRVDVASFTRFAIKNIGKKINKCLSKEGTVVLLEKILEENADKIKYFRKIRGYNFAKELFAAIASLRSGEITADDLEKVATVCGGKFGDKLSDIALIMREYDLYLAKNYSDTITRIDSLVDFVNEGHFADVNFYVLGFNMYSAQQLLLLKALAKNSLSLNIATVKSHRFYDPSSELTPLVKFCEENGVNVDIEEAFEVIQPVYNTIREGIFGGKNTSLDTDKVRVFNELTPFEEITAVAREITYLTRRENYRYKDIAVVCNDPELLPLVRETFSRCDIPCFLDEGYEVLEGVTIRYLTYLMEASDEMTQEKVFKFVRHPFCGLTREEEKEFFDYCVKYNIKYDRFLNQFSLGNYKEAEILRKRIAEKFILPKKATVFEYCNILKDILNGFAEVTEGFAKEKDARLVASAYTEQFVVLLEEMQSIIPEKQLSVGEFCSLIKSSAVDLKTILRPDNFDVVFVGNTEESRFSDISIIFVVGAKDGIFPKSSGDGLIFSLADNELMKQNGLAIFPTPMDRNLFEEFVVYDLLSRNADRFYISCASSDLSGDKQYPGDGFKEIALITGYNGKKLVDYHNLSEEGKFLYFLCNDKNAYVEYMCGTVPYKYRKGLEKYLIDRGLLIKQDIKNDVLIVDDCFTKNADGEYVTSVSQLETYFACPFRHYMRYCLRAEEPDSLVLKPSVIGTAIHNVLENFFKNNLNKVYTGENIDREMDIAINNEFSKPDYDSFKTDPLANYSLMSARSECKRVLEGLSDNIRHSSFRPEGFEVSFGYRNDSNRILLSTKDKVFRLRGKIDRVDGMGKDVYIVDYKTGHTEPELEAIFCGRKIQLYVYLKYFVEKGRRPVGVFYLPIKSGASKGGVNYACVGQMLKDGEVFRAIDNRCPNSGSYKSPTVNFATTVKEGVATFREQKNLFDSQDFANVLDYVFLLLQKGVEEISDGYVEKKPLEGECEYCPYKSMCGKVSSRVCRGIAKEDFCVKTEEKNV